MAIRKAAEPASRISGKEDLSRLQDGNRFVGEDVDGIGVVLVDFNTVWSLSFENLIFHKIEGQCPDSKIR